MIAAISAGIFVFLRVTAPTCFDGRQNQKEQGVDCGGPCAKECLGEIKDLVVLWSRPVKIADGKYDVVALAENRNLKLRSGKVGYVFKLYDERNILIASREGSTFANPGQKFALFEEAVSTGARVPARAYLEFGKNIKWELAKSEPPSLVVTGKNYDDSRGPAVSAIIANKSLQDALNVRAVAVIYDFDGNAVAGSATVLERLKGGASEEVFFTWPEILEGERDSEEIFVRAESASDF
ncbi:MAG: hypothetical protein HUT38_00565 [Candidatus Paceibacter sp.]|nr:hypothetical protein [Candidatus Paceibacter sp.]